MSLKVPLFAWRAFLRDLRAGELSVLLVAIVLAVTAMTAVGFFTDRVGASMKEQASQVLAADLVLRSAAPLPAVFQAEARKIGLATAETLAFPTVVLVGEETALAAVDAVGDGYPLRGQLTIADTLFGDGRPATAIPARGEAWAEPGLLGRLDIDVGATLTIGNLTLRVTQVLQYKPDQNIGFVNLAPGRDGQPRRCARDGCGQARQPRHLAPDVCRQRRADCRVPHACRAAPAPGYQHSGPRRCRRADQRGHRSRTTFSDPGLAGDGDSRRRRGGDGRAALCAAPPGQHRPAEDARCQPAFRAGSDDGRAGAGDHRHLAAGRAARLWRPVWSRRDRRRAGRLRVAARIRATLSARRPDRSDRGDRLRPAASAASWVPHRRCACCARICRRRA
jgi:hypothetical protein